MYTELDNLAWKLFLNDTPNSIVNNQAFFVYHKYVVAYE